MVSINPRSVLRPEYLSQANTINEKFNLFSEPRRWNTNTAPIYNSNNPCPAKKRLSTRKSPYLFTGQPSDYNSPSDHNFQFSNLQEPGVDHPALRLGASSIPLRMELSIKNINSQQNEFESFKLNNSPTSSFASRCSSDSSQSSYSSNSHRTRSCESNSNTSNVSNSKTSTTNNGHGQAEQLRRSKESTTFALIDTQLSKPPLSQIRDMYLQNRCGSTATGTSNPSRTTKKANLSVVHTVVRFRVGEYLVDLRQHMQRLTNILLSGTGSYYNQQNNRNANNSHPDISGLSRIPCTINCQFCYRLQRRIDGARAIKRQHSQSRHLRQCATSHPYSAWSPNSSDISPTPCSASSVSLSSAPVKLHINDFHVKDEAEEHSSMSDASINGEELDESNDEATIPSSVVDEHPLVCKEEVLETQLLDHVGDLEVTTTLLPPATAVPVKSVEDRFRCSVKPALWSTNMQTMLSQRSRLDSTSQRLCDDFDPNDWSANGIDFGPCGEEAVELHNLVVEDPLVSAFENRLEQVSADEIKPTIISPSNSTTTVSRVDSWKYLFDDIPAEICPHLPPPNTAYTRSRKADILLTPFLPLKSVS